MRALLPVLVLATAMLAGCGSGGGSPDTDGDGLYDNQELGGWDIRVDLLDRRVGRHVASDPGLRDTDGDGLEDVYEAALGTDPRSNDTDEDGLSDCQEGRHSVLAECLDPEFPGPTDGGTKTVVNRADSDPGASRYVTNVAGFTDETGTLHGEATWGDGLSDGQELAGYVVDLGGGRSVRVKTDPLLRDSDGDSLEDGEEALQFGSHPKTPDTDGDGCVDGVDPLPRAEERFRVGLTSLTWNEPGGPGQARLRFTLYVADSNLAGPGAPDGLQAQNGQTIDLTGHATQAVRPAQCSYTPYFPWVKITILVDRVDSSNGVELLDLQSQTNPASAFDLWWNLADDVFRWDPAQGPDLTGPQTWRGADGELRFDPTLELQGT